MNILSCCFKTPPAQEASLIAPSSLDSETLEATTPVLCSTNEGTRPKVDEPACMYDPPLASKTILDKAQSVPKDLNLLEFSDAVPRKSRLKGLMKWASMR